MELHDRVQDFVERTLGAMGLSMLVTISESPDGVRVDLAGDDGEVLLRRRAEALDALQHIVNTAFRRELDGDRSLVVDCLDYRKGKDAELKQMARFLMEKAKTTAHAAGDGTAQPLRAPAGASHRGRGSADVVGEHRRRIPEDGDHFLPEDK